MFLKFQNERGAPYSIIYFMLQNNPLWLLHFYENLTEHNLLESHFLFLGTLQTHPSPLSACTHSLGWLFWCSALMWFLETSKYFFPLEVWELEQEMTQCQSFSSAFPGTQNTPWAPDSLFSVITAQYFLVPFMDLSNARPLIILIFVKVQLKMNVSYQVTVLYAVPKLWCFKESKVSCFSWFPPLDPSIK